MKTLKVAEWLWWDKMSEIHDYRYNFSWNIKRYDDGEVVNDENNCLTVYDFEVIRETDKAIYVEFKNASKYGVKIWFSKKYARVVEEENEEKEIKREKQYGEPANAEFVSLDKVYHKKWGEGLIMSTDENTLHVRFADNNIGDKVIAKAVVSKFLVRI